MPSIEYDLAYLREALNLLESYLLSDELFWDLGANPPAGEPGFPALTLGGILLAQARLTARELDPATSAEFRTLSIHFQAIQTSWFSAWEKKGLRSFKSRLTQWGNFLEDYRTSPDSHADRFAYEIRLRLMLDLLAEGLPEIPSKQQQLLSSMDMILRRFLMGESFVWERDLQDGFPRPQYWYLYGHLV